MEMRPSDLLALSEMLRQPNQGGDSSDDDLPPPGLARLGPGNIGPKSKKGSKGEDKGTDGAGSSQDRGMRIFMSGSAAVGNESGGGRGGGGDVTGAENMPVVKPGDKNSIWCAEEVPQVTDDDNADPRPRPEYDICYRQAVSTEDVYLQMGGRTPATASCEDLVVRVRLPGERFETVSVSTAPLRVDVRSPAFRLPLALPHRVDPDSSRAQWDPSKHELTLTLRMDREFDYVNF